MSEPLLSAEETDALLAAMQEGDAEPDAEGIDLTSPERRIRTALPIADRAGVELAQLARRLFLRHAGMPAATDAAPAEINPYSVVVGGIRPGCAIVHLRIGESFGFLTLGPNLVTFLLDRQLGAPLAIGEPAPAVTREQLTAVEQRVLRPIVDELVQGISEHLCRSPDVLRILGVYSSATELPNTEPHEPVLRLSVSVNPGAAPPDEIVLVFASNAVSIAFGAAADEVEEQLSRAERDRIRRRVDVADVELIAVLGTAQSSVRSVLDLAVGDALRLDSVPDKPCRLVVADVTVLRGKPVTSHGNLAVEVTSR